MRLLGLVDHDLAQVGDRLLELVPSSLGGSERGLHDIVRALARTEEQVSQAEQGELFISIDLLDARVSYVEIFHVCSVG